MTTTSAHPMDGQNSNRDAGARDKLLHQMHELRRQALSTKPRNWTTEAVRHFLSNMKGHRARGIDVWNSSET